MEYENKIRKIKILITEFYHATLGAKQKSLTGLESFLSLKNSFENALTQIIDTYSTIDLTNEKNSALQEHFKLSSETLIQSISYSIHSLETECNATISELIASYKLIAHAEAKKNILEELERFREDTQNHITLLNLAYNQLDKKTTVSLNKKFLKCIGFQDNYPTAIEQTINAFTRILESQVNFKKLHEESKTDISDESLQVIVNEVALSYKISMSYIKHFTCIVKFAIELGHHPERVDNHLNLNIQHFANLLPIILNVQNGLLGLTEKLDIYNENNEFSEIMNQSISYLNRYIAEIERSILLLENNLSDTIVLVKAAAKYFNLFPKQGASKKELNEIARQFEMLASQSKILILKKFDYYEKTDSLEKRLQLKIEGFKCYHIFETCNLYKNKILEIKKALQEQSQENLTEPLVSLRAQYLADSEKNTSGIFEIIMDGIESEMLNLKQMVETDKFKHFTNDIADGYFFYQARELSENYIRETALACLANFNLDETLNFIIKNLDVISKSSIDSFMNLGETITQLALQFNPSEHTIALCQDFLNALLAKRFHKQAYKVHTNLQAVINKKSVAKQTLPEIHDLEHMFEQAAQKQLDEKTYHIFIESVATHIKAAFRQYFNQLQPQNFKDENWHIIQLQYEESDNPLQQLIRLNENLELFCVRKIILVNNMPRMDLENIKNMYRIFCDLAEQLVSIKEMNGALAIYTGLTSSAITNLACFIERPVTDIFKNIFDIANHTATGFNNIEKKSSEPLLYAQFARYSEIDTQNKHLPLLFIRFGKFLDTFFSKTDNTNPAFEASVFGKRISDLNQANQMISSYSARSAADLEEPLLLESMKVNTSLNKIKTINLLGKKLEEFYKLNRQLRFNNNESPNDILIYLNKLIKEDFLPSLHETIEIIIILKSFSDETIVEKGIMLVLESYKNQILSIKSQASIDAGTKTKMITFFKELEENYILSKLKSSTKSDQPIIAVIDNVSKLLGEFSFLEKGIKALNHPKALLLMQVKKEVGFVSADIINQCINFFISHFNPEHPVESENIFNQFVVDTLRQQLIESFPSAACNINSMQNSLEFIARPVGTFALDESIQLIKNIYDMDSSLNDLVTLKKYILFIQELKNHLDHNKLLCIPLFESMGLANEIKGSVLALQADHEKFKYFIDEDEKDKFTQFESSLNKLSTQTQEKTKKSEGVKINILIEQLLLDKNDFAVLKNEIEHFISDIKQNSHLSNPDLFLSLAHANHPQYLAMQILYLKSIIGSDAQNNTSPISIRQIETILASLQAAKSDSKPIKLYKSTLLIANNDVKAYQTIFKCLLENVATSQEADLKIILGLIAYYEPSQIIRIALCQFPLLRPDFQEKLMYLLNTLLLEKNVCIEGNRKLLNEFLKSIEDNNLMMTDRLSHLCSQLDKMMTSPTLTPTLNIIEKNDIDILHIIDLFIRNESAPLDLLLKDMSQLLIYQFSSSSLTQFSHLEKSTWRIFCDQIFFAFLNFYGSQFNSEIRARFIHFFIVMAEGAASVSDKNIYYIFLKILNSELIQEDYLALKYLDQSMRIKMSDLNGLINNYVNTEMSLPFFHDIEENIQHAREEKDSYGAIVILGEVFYKLYIAHHNTIKIASRIILNSNILSFVQNYSSYLNIHEVDATLTHHEYLNQVKLNIAPVISTELTSLSTLTIFLRQTTKFELLFKNSAGKGRILEGKYAKRKLVQFLQSRFAVLYATCKDGSIDQIQSLISEFLTITHNLEELLLKQKILPQPEIDNFNSFILHPELIDLNSWYKQHRRNKKGALFNVSGRDPELDALWRIRAIIEKLAAIDKFTKKLGGKINIEKILALKTIQRKMMNLSFEIKDAIEKSEIEVQKGGLISYDHLDIFHWKRTYLKFEDEINTTLGIERKKIIPLQQKRKWGWRTALAMLGFATRQDQTAPLQSTGLNNSETTSHATMPSPESPRQDQLLSSLSTILAGSHKPEDNDGRGAAQPMNNQAVLPFSTEFLIRSFLQSFAWASREQQMNIPKLKSENLSVQLLGSPIYIPTHFQVEIVNLVLVAMDTIGKLAGPQGEYAQINLNKIESLVEQIEQANQVVNKYFIDATHPIDTAQIDAFETKFKLKREKISEANLKIHEQVLQNNSVMSILNPDLNNFLHYNENLMHQMITDNVFDLEYISILSPAVEPVSGIDDDAGNLETEALLDLLLNREPDQDDSANQQVAH